MSTRTQNIDKETWYPTLGIIAIIFRIVSLSLYTNEMDTSKQATRRQSSCFLIASNTVKINENS